MIVKTTYIYTVTNRQTGEVVAKGNLVKCAAAIGVHQNTIKNMAMDPHSRHRVRGYGLKYEVTRAAQGKERDPRAKYYAIYCKKTDAILACGSAEECAKAMGWAGADTVHQNFSREKKHGDTPYEFYSEPLYPTEEEDMA